MGIIVPPGPPDYGDDCITCFAAGETPETCWLIVSGMIKGAGWLIGMPESINGTFELTQTEIEPCLWGYVGTGFSWAYHSIGLGFPEEACLVQGLILPPFFVDGFRGSQLFPCKLNFTNKLTEPPNKPFVGGTAIVFF